ncbi:TetR/AcrR family transcriptional regulator [Phytomonospora sp. NPDC050363]|uniref:TetR/AcrR family transcriptional regulator n=1 Tax=Phytomonospora sp. NPDC050363 TaxID=3155642 RepID=UPI0033CF9B3F
MTGPNVPPELRRLWRMQPSSPLGRPAELDVERVLGAALDLADRHGLPGVTLPKVADALGVTKMALYRYVGSKDELFSLLADMALTPPPTAEPGEDWRTALRRWALANREVYRTHPWLAQLPVTGPPSGPNAIAWMDAMLHILRETALTWPEKTGVLLLVGGWVRQTGLISEEFGSGGRDQREVERDYGRALIELVEPERFPDAARLFQSQMFEAPDPYDGDPDFDFGLETILDGVSARIAAAAKR